MAPPRRPRSSYVPHAARASVPATVSDRASSIFPYSTARPPTGYSQQSWIAPDKSGPHGSRTPGVPGSATDYEEEMADDRETPLYARSDWGSETGGDTAGLATPAGRRSMPMGSARSSRSRRPQGRNRHNQDDEYDADEKWREKSTAWTQSSWAGPRTDDLHPVPELPEADERDYEAGSPDGVTVEDSPAARQGGKDRHAAAIAADKRRTVLGGALMASPGLMSDMGTAQMTVLTGKSGRYSLPYARDSARRTTGFSDGRTRPQSELPSVFSLGQLQQTATLAGGAAHGGGPVDPFHDHNNGYARDGLGNERQLGWNDGALGRQDPALMSPEAQQRLGRMSVAPARYSFTDGLPPTTAYPGDTMKPDHMHQVDDQSFWAKPFGKGLLTYRPHLNALAAVLAASLLTVCLTGYKGLGGLIEVKSGGFGYMRSKNGAGAVLGISGWCEIHSEGEEACETYTSGDFSDPATAFSIPGNDTVLTTLSYAMTALTAIAWLLAAFNLATLALRSILFFGLSLPASHIMDAVYPTRQGREKARKIPGEILSPRSRQPKGEDDDDDAVQDGPLFGIEEVQAEVDMRVRCERPPFESWEWVWWAWWAHRRGPVGHIFATLAGLMGLVTLGLGVGFEKQVSAAAAAEDSVSLSAGVFLPLVAALLIVDQIYESVRYWIHATFLQPPEPTPAAILLPASLRPMRKIVQSTGTFFAPQTTLPPGADFDIADDPFADTPTAHNMADLDPETIRWLAAYPADPELVPLIARLRGGEDHTDFVLSETGLLYLKPDPDAAGGDGEGSQNALLIPPAGSIRHELLEDAHLELLEGEDSGGSAHWGPETMLAILSETFWWVEMEDDIQALVEACPICTQAGPRTATGEQKEVMVAERKVRMSQLAPGMTPLPFTGVTGWTGLGTASAAGPGKPSRQETGFVTIGESAMAAEIAFATRKAEEEARDVEILR